MLPVLGAASAFLLNLLLKSQLTATEYGEFASILFVIAILYMIAGLGFEQVLVRLTEVDCGKVVVKMKIAIGAFLVVIFSPLLCHLILTGFGIIDGVDERILMSSFLISVSNLISTVYKINGSLLSHYLFMHTWKLILLLFVLIKCFLINNSEVSYSDLIFLSILIAFIGSCIFSSLKGVTFLSEEVSTLKLCLYFIAGATSIIGFSIFDSLDRFLVRDLFDKAVFGDYFFIFAFIMSPVGIVSGYVSTKQLRFYKENFSVSVFKYDYYRVLAVSAIIAIFFSTLIEFLTYFGVIKLMESYHEILLIICLISIVRGGYAVLSMTYSILCSSQVLILIGVVFSSMSIGAFYLLTNTDRPVSIISLGLLLLLMWGGRSATYWFLILRDAKASHFKSV